MKHIALSNLIKISFVGLLMVAGSLYAAEPTIPDVYHVMQSGRLQEAELMMTEVIKAHPDSAKAYFIDAEILAKEGRLGESRAQLSRAEGLRPDLQFAKPEAIASLKHQLGIQGPKKRVLSH